MSYIHVIEQQDATGTVAEDYDYLANAYGMIFQCDSFTPRVYTTSSVIPAYFRYGALQNRVLTGDGTHVNEGGPLPRTLVNFAVAFYSACFY
ncbi:MAG: hypothetical protein ACI915_003784 [Gammaproteobacteria bacterium]|jgi:hypothetical protein